MEYSPKLPLASNNSGGAVYGLYTGYVRAVAGAVCEVGIRFTESQNGEQTAAGKYFDGLLDVHVAVRYQSQA